MNAPSVHRKKDLLQALDISLPPIVIPLVKGNVSAAADKVGFVLPDKLTLSKIAGRLATGGAGTNTTKTVVDMLIDGVSVLRERLAHVLVYTAGDQTYTDQTDAAWTVSGSDAFEFCAATGDRLYIGHHKPFRSLWYSSAVAGNTGAATFKYSRAGDTTPAGSFSGLTNGTLGSKPFDQSGLITWTMPSNWAPITINGISAYWMSVALAATITTAPQAAEISIADGLIQIAKGDGSAVVTDIVTLAKPLVLRAGETISLDIKAVPETTPPTDLSVSLGPSLL